MTPIFVPNTDELGSLHELAKTVGAGLVASAIQGADLKAVRKRAEGVVEAEVGKLTIEAIAKELESVTDENVHRQLVIHLFNQFSNVVPRDKSLSSYHIALAAVQFAWATLNVYIDDASNVYASQAFGHPEPTPTQLKLWE